MRTTLTIDDDVAQLLQREMTRKGMTLKEIVNSSLRRGLSLEEAVPPVLAVTVRPHDFGFKPGIDRDKLNQLADELEAEATAAAYRRSS